MRTRYQHQLTWHETYEPTILFNLLTPDASTSQATVLHKRQRHLHHTRMFLSHLCPVPDIHVHTSRIVQRACAVGGACGVYGLCHL